MDFESDVVATAEYEGDSRSIWWFVCSECHGPIAQYVKRCPHCKANIVWSDFEIGNKLEK